MVAGSLRISGSGLRMKMILPIPEAGLSGLDGRTRLRCDLPRARPTGKRTRADVVRVHLRDAACTTKLLRAFPPNRCARLYVI